MQHQPNKLAHLASALKTSFDNLTTKVTPRSKGDDQPPPAPTNESSTTNQANNASVADGASTSVSTEETIRKMNRQMQAEGIANRALLLCQFRGHTMHIVRWDGKECSLDCITHGSDFAGVKAVSYRWMDVSSCGVTVQAWSDLNAVPALKLSCAKCGMRAQSDPTGLDVRCLPPGRYWIDHLCSRFDNTMSDIYLSLVPYVKGDRIVVGSRDAVKDLQERYRSMQEVLDTQGWATWAQSRSKERDMFMKLAAVFHEKYPEQRGWLVWEEAMAPAVECIALSEGSVVAHSVGHDDAVITSEAGALFRLCGLWNDDIEASVRFMGLLVSEIVDHTQMTSHVDIIRACGEIGAGFAVRELVAQQVFENISSDLKASKQVLPASQPGMMWGGSRSHTQWTEKFPVWYEDVGYLTLYEHIRSLPDLCISAVPCSRPVSLRACFRVRSPKHWCAVISPVDSNTELVVNFHMETKDQIKVDDYSLGVVDDKEVPQVTGDAMKVRIFLWATVEAVLSLSPRHVYVL